jgi:hypothetical protein
MKRILDDIRVRYRPDDGRWELLDDFVYHLGASDSPRIVNVGAGFVTDFASIPRLFWNLVAPTDPGVTEAALVHDWLYQYPVLTNGEYLTRVQADGVFLDVMNVVDRVARWKRRPMWLAVRVGGWKPWNAYRKAEGYRG